MTIKEAREKVSDACMVMDCDGLTCKTCPIKVAKVWLAEMLMNLCPTCGRPLQ